MEEFLNMLAAVLIGVVTLLFFISTAGKPRGMRSVVRNAHSDFLKSRRRR
jgi:hypothetical protein